MSADSISLERIKQAHPKIRTKLLNTYNYINEKVLGKYVRLRLAYVYRSPEEQHKLFLQRPKVTQADSWQSIHQYCVAWDIVLLLDRDKNGSFEEATWDTIKDFDQDGVSDWMEVVKAFKDIGAEWGGSWKFKDMPHFQITFNLTWKQMKAKIDSGDYTTEIVNGIKIKYINI